MFGLGDGIAVAAVCAVLATGITKWIPRRNHTNWQRLTTLPAVVSQSDKGIPVLNALGVCPEHAHLCEMVAMIKDSNDDVLKTVNEMSNKLSRVIGYLDRQAGIKI